MTDHDELAAEIGAALSEGAQHSFRVAVKKSDRIRQARRGPGVGDPMAEWENTCRCRLARLYLTPEGWHFIGNDRRVHHPTDWLHRYMTTPDGEPVTDEHGTPVTLDARDAGQITFNEFRKVRGVSDTFPLEIDDWPTPYRIPVGCDHGEGHLPIADVMAVARKVRDTRVRLRKRLRIHLN